MMRIRISDARVTRYVWRFLNSRKARRYFQERATGTAGNMPKINSATLRCRPVPVHAPDLLPEINQHLDRAEATKELVAREADRALALLDRLEQSILARAFRGELVPQDPNDEPAVAMLARLRPNPAASPAPRRRAPGRPRSAR